MKQNSVYPVFHQLRDGQQKEKDGPPAADAEADDNGDTGGEQCQERYIPAAVRASLRPSQRRLKEVCADMTAMLQSLSGQIDHLLSAGCLTQMTLLCQLAQPAAVEAAALRVHLWVDMSRVFPKQTVYHAQTLQRPVKAERAQLCKAPHKPAQLGLQSSGVFPAVEQLLQRLRRRAEPAEQACGKGGGNQRQLFFLQRLDLLYAREKGGDAFLVQLFQISQ